MFDKILTYITLTLSTLATSQDAFLEGFPDIPLLSGLQETHEGAKFIFDTPTGTIAETTLETNQSGSQVITRYYTNLKALGWDCSQNQTQLTCMRDHHKLTLASKDNAGNKTILTLRIEPKQG